VRYGCFALRELSGGTPDRADTAELTIEVHNAGLRPAQELVQVYASAPGHPSGFPRRLLVGHERVDIPAGGSATAVIRVPLERLATFNVAAGRLVVEPGSYLLLAGASAADLPLAVTLEVAGSPTPGRSRGAWFRAETFDACGNLALVPETPLAGTAIAPAGCGQPAWSVYRGFSTEAAAGQAAAGAQSVLLDVVSCTPSGPAARATVRVQVPGPAGTWNTAGTGHVDAAFTGVLRIPLGQGPAVGAAGFRLVFEGGVTVSRVQLA
jgi:beta-glucosidase